MFVNPTINFIARFYNWIIWLGEHLQSLFLLILRLIWGHQFYLTGKEKLQNIEQVTHFFSSLGLAHPEFHAYLVSSVELIGGILLFIGFASRLASIPLIITMLSAYGLAHARIFIGFHFIADPTLLIHEAPFPFLMTAVIVLLFGPGRISTDAWIKRRSEHWEKF